MKSPSRTCPLRAVVLVTIACALALPEPAAAQDKPPTLTELKQAAARGEAQLKKVATAMAALDKRLAKWQSHPSTDPTQQP